MGKALQVRPVLVHNRGVLVPEVRSQRLKNYLYKLVFILGEIIGYVKLLINILSYIIFKL